MQRRRVAVGAGLHVPLGVEPGMRTVDRTWWVVATAVALLSAALLLAGVLPSSSEPATPLTGPDHAHETRLETRLAEALTFDEDVLADVTAYRSPRRVMALASQIIGVAVPLAIGALLLGDRGGRVLRLRVPLALPLALQVGVAAALVVLATALVRLPLAVGAGVVQDGAWGFRTRSVPGWALDHLLVVTGRAAGVGLLVAAVVALAVRHPRTWPARVSVLVAVVGPLALLLHPLVVHPLLLPTGPMPDGEHRDAVIAVVARSGVDVPVLLGEASLRTTRRNAVVTGLGPTQRVVLHDTLLELGPREVAAITAHELAHIERRDPLRGVLAPVPLVLIAGLLVRRRLSGSPDPRVAAAVVALVIAAEAALTPVAAAVHAPSSTGPTCVRWR
jgi:Zn-dependent protease with chaperone function